MSRLLILFTHVLSNSDLLELGVILTPLIVCGLIAGVLGVRFFASS